MATIPQQPENKTVYQYAASLLRAGKKTTDIEAALVADGLSQRRAKAIVKNLQHTRKASFTHYVSLHPRLHKIKNQVTRLIRRK